MSPSLKWRIVLPAGLLLVAASALAGCSPSKPAPTASPSAATTATAPATTTPSTPSTPTSTVAPSTTATAPTTATPAPPAAARLDVAVTLKDFAVVATPASITAGKVTFAVQNAGVSPHEFVIVKSDLAPDSLPQVNQKTVDEKQVQVIGKVEPFDGGSKRELALELQPGRYVLLCNIPSHYISGMYTAFAVTAVQ
ncbi:MAG: hypothetical protein EPO16_00830 [Dehalococcoidia bacterium]|nr:MAG: hypothetical protein EPO16_00830 [Dehalococcoidia bacterium]